MSKFAGLEWDATSGKGRIRKRIRGTSVSKRFTARTREEAEAIYYQVIAAPKTPSAGHRTFRAAATHYLETETKKSMDRDAFALQQLMPHIGNLPLDRIHQGTLSGYIAQRKDTGISSGTVIRELAVVRRILTLASRYWRDEDGLPWLPIAPPLFRLPDWGDRAKPYPLSHEEEQSLISALPEHLALMALFGINTGARDSVISCLRWQWLRTIDEIGGRSVFIVPGEYTKNGTDCLIPLNARAEAIIQSVKGRHPTHVFTWLNRLGQQAPVLRMHNSGWKAAWKRSGLPSTRGINKGPHNLRHTFARRLRASMVPHETIKALLHHIDGDITLNYAPSQLQDLFRAVDSILERKTLLRAVK